MESGDRICGKCVVNCVPKLRVQGKTPVSACLAVCVLSMVTFLDGKIDKVDMNSLEQCVVNCAHLINDADEWMVAKVAYDYYLQSGDISFARKVIKKLKKAQKNKGTRACTDCAYSQPRSLLEYIIQGSHSADVYNGLTDNVEQHTEDLIQGLSTLLSVLPVFVVSECMFQGLRALPWGLVALSTQRVRAMVDDQMGDGFLDVRRNGVKGYSSPWLWERDDFERWSCNDGRKAAYGSKGSANNKTQLLESEMFW